MTLGGPHYYDFDGEPLELMEWAHLFEMRAREPDLVRWLVGYDEIGDVRVSTVWIGIDQNWWADGPPLIFESMIFGGAMNDECYRYSTADEAAAGHSHLVALGAGRGRRRRGAAVSDTRVTVTLSFDRAGREPIELVFTKELTQQELENFASRIHDAFASVGPQE